MGRKNERLFALGVFVWDSLKTAAASLWAARFRATLTLSGIVTGCFTFTGVSGILDGKLENDLGELKRLGSTFVSVRMVERVMNGEPISIEHGDTIAATVQNIAAYSPVFAGETRIRTRLHSGYADIVGVRASIQEVVDLRVVSGRFFLANEGRAADNVAVIGAGLARQLRIADVSEPVTVSFYGYPMRVVGIMEQRSGLMPGCGEYDDCALMPTETLRELRPRAPLVLLAFKANNEDFVPAIASAVRLRLRPLLGLPRDAPDSFQVITASDLRRRVKRELTLGAAISTGVVLLTLLVAGVGVMNTMLLTVAERTAEIGLRKAVGARSTQILAQFMVEALMLCGAGGLVGTAGGVIAARQVSESFLPGVQPALPPSLLLSSVGFSLATGLVFGFGPAMKAARLRPMEALRTE